MKDKGLINIGSMKKKEKEKVIEACMEGKLTAYIKHPLTGEPISVDLSLVKRLKAGEEISINEILKDLN